MFVAVVEGRISIGIFKAGRGSEWLLTLYATYRTRRLSSMVRPRPLVQPCPHHARINLHKGSREARCVDAEATSWCRLLVSWDTLFDSLTAEASYCLLLLDYGH